MQVQDTLKAIQEKDPRVYDSNATFYTEPEDDTQDRSAEISEQTRPMFLKDYHRNNLLEGPDKSSGTEPSEPTYAQQQDYLKRSIVKEMHESAQDEGNGGEMVDSGGEEFLTRRPIPAAGSSEDRLAVKHSQLDIERADKDPDKYLADFMSSRAWVPTKNSRFQPMESDDEEEERQADAFEEAFNMRFEKPETANEKILTHSRDAAAKFSFRKESMNPRQKARDVERARKESEKQVRAEEKARLRRLKLSELEQKVRKIQETAGVLDTSLSGDDWASLINGAWDDENWDQSMRNHFGEEYYAAIDVNGVQSGQGKGRPKKPKWEDDIDINDLVSTFEAGKKGETSSPSSLDEAASRPSISGKGSGSKAKIKPSGNVKGEKVSLERRELEDLVDEELDTNEKLANFGKKHATHFRYRETSPVAWGLTAADILMAEDSQLNQFAGLKKLAAFREPEKKRRDKKHLGKKARLKRWRLDTFGDELGAQNLLTSDATQQSSKKHRSATSNKVHGGNGTDKALTVD